MAKHAAGTHPVLLSFTHLFAIGLWGSAFAPILTVGLWSGKEAQFRRRFEFGPSSDVIQGTIDGGPLLGCMIGGIVNTYVGFFFGFFFSFFFFKL